jgi:hypothetical protein
MLASSCSCRVHLQLAVAACEQQCQQTLVATALLCLLSVIPVRACAVVYADSCSAVVAATAAAAAAAAVAMLCLAARVR